MKNLLLLISLNLLLFISCSSNNELIDEEQNVNAEWRLFSVDDVEVNDCESKTNIVIKDFSFELTYYNDEYGCNISNVLKGEVVKDGSQLYIQLGRETELIYESENTLILNDSFSMLVFNKQ